MTGKSSPRVMFVTLADTPLRVQTGVTAVELASSTPANSCMTNGVRVVYLW